MHTALTGAGAASARPNRLPSLRLATVVEWLLRRDEAFRARSDLHRLDDHMLRDIGLTRDLIDEAVRGADRT